MLFIIGIAAGCGSNNSDAPIRPDDNNTIIEGGGAIKTLSIENGSVLKVGVNSATQVIKIRALDENNILVNEGKVVSQYPKQAYGTLTPAVVAVTSGIVSFEYTPPANIQDLLDRNITSETFRFYAADVNGTIDSKVFTDLNITFTSTSTSPTQSVLKKITILKKEYQASYSGEKITVTVYAFDQNNNVMPNVNLKLIKGGTKFSGSIPQQVKTINGEGNLPYTAPQNFPLDPEAQDTILIKNATLDM